MQSTFQGTDSLKWNLDQNKNKTKAAAMCGIDPHIEHMSMQLPQKGLGCCQSDVQDDLFVFRLEDKLGDCLAGRCIFYAGIHRQSYSSGHMHL